MWNLPVRSCELAIVLEISRRPQPLNLQIRQFIRYPVTLPTGQRFKQQRV